MNVGLTGGIGSGKSLVASMFEVLGVPVFWADDAAKYLMEQDEELRQQIIQAFGNEVYIEGRLNRPFLASIVFQNKAMLDKLNSLVHPAVIVYSKRWASAQSAPYTIKEAAIFFESGSYKEMDKMIGVYAPEALRIKRTMQRDGIDEQQVRLRMDKQMKDEEKMQLCDYVIKNDESVSVIEQVLQLHEILLADV